MISREKTRIGLAIAIVVSMLAGCGPSPEEQIAVTATHTVITATDIPMLTDTPAPIDTPPPTETTLSTETPVLVPRYMLPSAPNFPMEILGAKCNYQGDIWGEKAAYIAYDCPDLNVTWLSARFTNLEEGEVAMDLFDQIPSETNMGVVNSRIGPKDLFGQLPSEGATSITPAGLLSEYDNIIILGRVENFEYAYFMVYETESYAISSEVFFPEDTATLEEFYSDNVEKVFHAVLEIMLENTKSGGASLQPTPMALDQQNLYNQIAPWLVTMPEANEFYQGASDMFGDSFDGTWVPIGDDINAERESICRIFEDRSNADAPLVAFFNCVYIRPDFDLNKIRENFPNSVVLESAFQYPDQSIIYGHKLNNGHTSLNAFIIQDEYLIYMFVESRTLMGKPPEDVFEGFNDDFIYNVLMTNLERYAEGKIIAPLMSQRSSQIQERGNIQIGVRDDDMYPMTFQEGSIYKGFEIELATEIVYRLFGDQLVIEWIPLTAQERIEAVQNGNVDFLIRNLTHTTSRAELVSFSSTYFLEGGSENEPLAIAVSKTDPVFRNEIDKILLEIIADGTWQEIYDRWFDDPLSWTIDEMLSVPPANR